MKWTIGTTLVIAAATLAPLSSRAQVNVVSGHPRIYLRTGDLASLRARAGSAAIAPYYNELKSRMDGTQNRHSNDEVAAFEMESLALCHVVEAPSSTYRDKVLVGWVRSGYSAGSMSHWNLPYQVMAHAIALDWMWDDLDSGQRTDLGQTIVALMDDCYDYSAHDLGPDPSYANQMSDYSNQLYYHLGALALAGIALSGEGIDDTRAQFYLDEADTLLHNHMIPAMNQEAGGDAEMSATSGFVGNGGWGEDMGHTDMTHPLFGRMLEAWRTGVGEDLFPRTNGIASVNKYIVYMTRPNGEVSPKGNGDYGNGLSDKNNGTLGCLTSARYGDRYGKLVKDRTHQGTTYGFHQLGAVLWYDAALPDLVLADLPETIHFQGQGEVVVRSGFGTDDTWVYLRSGPIYNGHQHDDQGNLLIEAYGGELFVENAGSGIDPTVNHNTLRVGGDQIPYGNNQVQYVRVMAGTAQERGRVTELQLGAEYTYVATDFGSAYDDAQVAPPKSGKVTREMVVVLPDIVVVRDRVTGSGAVEMLLHVWNGNASVDTGTQTVTVVDGPARGWVRTLLPEVALFTQSGQETTDLIAVSASSPQATEVFLHLFYLSPSASPFTPDDVVLIDQGGEQGVQLTDRDGDSWQVRFVDGVVGLASVRKNDIPVSVPDAGPRPDAASTADATSAADAASTADATSAADAGPFVDASGGIDAVMADASAADVVHPVDSGGPADAALVRNDAGGGDSGSAVGEGCACRGQGTVTDGATHPALALVALWALVVTLRYRRRPA